MWARVLTLVLLWQAQKASSKVDTKNVKVDANIVKLPPFRKWVPCPWAQTGPLTCLCRSYWCRTVFSTLPSRERSTVEESSCTAGSESPLHCYLSWLVFLQNTEASEYTLNVPFCLCCRYAPAGCRHHSMLLYFSILLLKGWLPSFMYVGTELRVLISGFLK